MGSKSAAVGVKRPRGRAPKGKEWDYSAGRWVDAPVAPPPEAPLASAALPTPEKAPAADKEKEKAKPKKAATPKKVAAPKAAGAVADKPRGRPPKGKAWDAELGNWVPMSPDQAAAAAAKPKPPPKDKLKSPAKAALAPAGGAVGKRPRGRAPKGKVWDTALGWINE